MFGKYLSKITIINKKYGKYKITTTDRKNETFEKIILEKRCSFKDGEENRRHYSFSWRKP
jgi:hypothetical protein